MVLWVWSRVSRHRPSLQYPLPKAQRAGTHGERRLRERGSNSRTATNAACFQYFERRGRRILRLFSSLHLITIITTLSSSEYFPALGHRGKRVFTPRPPTNPLLSCLDLSTGSSRLPPPPVSASWMMLCPALRCRQGLSGLPPRANQLLRRLCQAGHKPLHAHQPFGVLSSYVFDERYNVTSDNAASNTKHKIKEIDQIFSEDGRQQCFGEISQVSKI